MRSIRRVSALLTLAAALAQPLAGQPLRATSPFPGHGLAGPTDLPAWQTEPESAKDPGLALILAVAPGFIGIHGAGSFYAGNHGHGWRHLGIGLAGIGMALAAYHSCGIGCSDSSDTLGAAGMILYLGNWVWSTIVAQSDVRARNNAPR